MCLKISLLTQQSVLKTLCSCYRSLHDIHIRDWVAEWVSVLFLQVSRPFNSTLSTPCYFLRI